MTWQVSVRRLTVGWLLSAGFAPGYRWTLTRAGAVRVALRWGARMDAN